VSAVTVVPRDGEGREGGLRATGGDDVEFLPEGQVYLFGGVSNGAFRPLILFSLLFEQLTI
jgi:hypothetical protein